MRHIIRVQAVLSVYKYKRDIERGKPMMECEHVTRENRKAAGGNLKGIYGTEFTEHI